VPSHEVPLDPGLAYQAQGLVRDRLQPQGDIVGFKLGYTSEVMRRAMGIDEPNHGALFDSSVLTSPAVVDGLIQPKVEPEIAVRVDRSGVVIEYLTSLEVVDSIWKDYHFTWSQNTADGSSAAFAVVGGPVGASIEDVRVTLRSSAGESRTAELRDSCPDIAASVAWLATHPSLPRSLRDDDLVLTGGLTAPLDLESGGWIEAVFESTRWKSQVRVQRVEEA
jgi:2-keto-4-pentenoate hydratase